MLGPPGPVCGEEAAGKGCRVSFSLVDLEAPVGAEVRGLVVGALGDHDEQRLRRALADHGLLVVRGLDLAIDMLAIARQTIGSIVVNEERLREAFTSGIFATDEALRRVAAGESFRDAYRAVGASLGDISADSIDIDALIRQRTATGSPGNPDVESVISLVKKRRGELDLERKKVSDAVSVLAGTSVSLYAPPRES